MKLTATVTNVNKQQGYRKYLGLVHFSVLTIVIADWETTIISNSRNLKKGPISKGTRITFDADIRSEKLIGVKNIEAIDS